MRSAAAERYDALLRDVAFVAPPPVSLPGLNISWFVYVIRLAPHVDRERVQTVMSEQGIGTGRYFPPIHLQPAWRSVAGASDVCLPVTESIARRTLALPFFNRITESQQEEVIAILRSAIGKT